MILFPQALCDITAGESAELLPVITTPLSPGSSEQSEKSSAHCATGHSDLCDLRPTSRNIYPSHLELHTNLFSLVRGTTSRELLRWTIRTLLLQRG
jgi:hypothetical protein